MAYYRPKFRQQKPSVDPKEPWRGESNAKGDEHAWNNCTMTSGAMALDYQTKGAKQLWGGDLRHAQSDLSGGTDLSDLKQAWARKGQTLLIRSGQGWAGVIASLREGRAVVIQGTGDTPGSGTYKGPHAAIWLPDRAWGDPLANKWQRVDNGDIRRWAERLNSRIQFAVTRARPS
jgi:hypothetical protein